MPYLDPTPKGIRRPDPDERAELSRLLSENADDTDARLPSVVADIAARDLLTPYAGQIVHVLSGADWQVWNGAAWSSLNATYVAQSLIDAAGDLLVGSADNTLARLARGSALQVLRVNAAGTALEYATPTPGAQVAAGSYTGNGATDRTISLAFDPKDVRVTSGFNSWWAAIGSDTRGIKIANTTISKPDTNAQRPLLTSGGFVVSGNGGAELNQSGITFNYVAIG